MYLCMSYIHTCMYVCICVWVGGCLCTCVIVEKGVGELCLRESHTMTLEKPMHLYLLRNEITATQLMESKSQQ